MKRYTAADLEAMDILAMRKVARGLQLDIKQKTRKELIRGILSAQKPGGKDARARPEYPATVPAKMPKVPKQPAQLNEVLSGGEANTPHILQEMVKYIGDLINRVSYLEAALIEQDIIEPMNIPDAPVKQLTVGTGRLPEDWFDDRGELCMTAEEVYAASYAILQLINAHLPADARADIADLHRKPRLAAERVTRALEEAGKLYHQDQRIGRGRLAQRSMRQAQAAPHDPCPPQNKGDKCEVYDDGVWRPGRYTGNYYDEVDKSTGQPITFWKMRFSDESGNEYTCDFAEDELRPLRAKVA
jgi:hypothetical protein